MQFIPDILMTTLLGNHNERVNKSVVAVDEKVGDNNEMLGNIIETW